MEDNQQCNNILAEDIVQLMELDVLSQSKGMPIEGHDKDAEDDDSLKEDKPREQVSFDEVNALAVQLKSLQVKISKLGGEYHAVALAMSNEYDNILSIYYKNETKNYQGNRRLPIKH